MKAAEIKSGRFYRFRHTSTVWAILYVWPEKANQPASAEVMVITEGLKPKIDTRIHPLEELGRWLTCEVFPSWKPITPYFADNQLPEKTPADEDEEPETLAESSWLNKLL